MEAAKAKYGRLLERLEERRRMQEHATLRTAAEQTTDAETMQVVEAMRPQSLATPNSAQPANASPESIDIRRCRIGPEVDVGFYRTLPLPSQEIQTDVVKAAYARHNQIVEEYIASWSKHKMGIRGRLKDLSKAEVDLRFGEADSNFAHPSSFQSHFFDIRDILRRKLAGEDVDRELESEKELLENLLRRQDLHRGDSDSEAEDRQVLEEILEILRKNTHAEHSAEAIADIHLKRAIRFQELYDNSCRDIEVLKAQHVRAVEEAKLSAELKMKAMQVTHDEEMAVVSSTLQETVKLLHKKSEEYDELVRECKQKEDESREVIRQLQEKVEMAAQRHSADVAEFNERYDELSKEVSEERKAHKACQKDLAASAAREHILQETLDSERLAAEQKIQAMTESLSDSKSGAANLAERLNEDAVRISNLLQQISEGEKQQKAGECVLAAEREKVSSLVTGRDQFEAELRSTVKAEMENLQARLTKCIHERDEALVDLRRLTDQVTCLNKTISDNEAQRMQVMSMFLTVGKMQEAVEQSKTRLAAVSKRRLELVAENYVLRNRLAVLMRPSRSQEVIDVLQQQCAWLTQKLQEATRRHVNVGRQRATCLLAEDAEPAPAQQCIYEADAAVQVPDDGAEEGGLALLRNAAVQTAPRNAQDVVAQKPQFLERYREYAPEALSGMNAPVSDRLEAAVGSLREIVAGKRDYVPNGTCSLLPTGKRSVPRPASAACEKRLDCLEECRTRPQSAAALRQTSPVPLATRSSPTTEAPVRLVARGTHGPSRAALQRNPYNYFEALPSDPNVLRDVPATGFSLPTKYTIGMMPALVGPAPQSTHPCDGCSDGVQVATAPVVHSFAAYKPVKAAAGAWRRKGPSKQ